MNEISAIIGQLHDHWLDAKRDMARRCRRAGDSAMARRIDYCRLFRGDESPAEAAALMASPAGLEFCMAAGFPSLTDCRRLRPYDAGRYGLYIDAGDITVTDEARVILIGDTRARVSCTKCARYTVAAMHGASAIVEASGWAIVYTAAARGSRLEATRSGQAIVL